MTDCAVPREALPPFLDPRNPKGERMRIVVILLGILVLFGIGLRAQSGPFAPNATIALEVQPASPVAGSDFTVRVYVNLLGVANSSAIPAALGGFVIPIGFDNTRVTLKAVSEGTASAFGSSLRHTEISQANARGCVTVVNAQTGAGTPTGSRHVATLTFTADQGGSVQFTVNSARASHEGSLASTYDPANGGGPALISYADAPATVQLAPGDVPYHLIYPVFVSTATDFQGIVIVNQSATAAALTFRAYGVDGSLLTKNGMINPSTLRALPCNTQHVKLVDEVFGLSATYGSDRGWVDVESTSPNISGFFLIGHTANGATTELDGADVSHTLTAHAIFPVIGKDEGKSTTINVVNPGSNSAAGILKLQKSDGTTQQTIPVSIPPKGVFEHAFPSTALPGNGYVELKMSAGMVTGLEKFGTANSLACLAALDADKASNVLYAPHFASGNAGAHYFTDINVVNPSSQPAATTFRLLDEQGAENVSPVTRTIAPKSQLRIRGDQLFGLPDPAGAAEYTTGVIKVESDRGLVGSITFGDTSGAFLSSLPLLSTSSAKRDVYLDHVALGTIAPITYWTGIAVVNASRERDAHVTIELYDTNGKLVGQTSRTILKKSRLLSLVSALDPSFNVNQFGGFVHINSDVEVFTFMLFGDAGQTFLSAVPVR